MCVYLYIHNNNKIYTVHIHILLCEQKLILDAINRDLTALIIFNNFNIFINNKIFFFKYFFIIFWLTFILFRNIFNGFIFN